MIGPGTDARVLVATRPVDFRKGADSLAAMMEAEYGADPFSGVVYVFRAKRADRIKLVWWDGTGLIAQLVTDALMMAIWRRGKPDALLHHSDQGSQYTSDQFQRLMADNGVTCYMSRLGNVWDNAAMESFFSSLKTERIGRKTYRTRNHAKADVFDYIERFYNPTRRHSTLGYLSPMDFEKQANVA